MNSELTRKQIHDLIDIALDTNGFEQRQRSKTGTLPTVFFEYSGHVNSFKMELFPDGWTTGGNRQYVIDTYLDRPISEESIEHARRTCADAMKDAKESEVLERDIESKIERINQEKKELSEMRKNLRKMQKKEGLRDDGI